MSNELSSSDSSEMMTLVRSVRSNIDHIYKLLDMVVNKGVSSAEMTIINKLRNDISKEEVYTHSCIIGVFFIHLLCLSIAECDK